MIVPKSLYSNNTFIKRPSFVDNVELKKIQQFFFQENPFKMILKLNLSSGFDVLQSTVVDIMLYTTQAVNRIKKESIFNFISFYLQRLILFTFHINNAAESSNDVSNLKWLLMLRIFFQEGISVTNESSVAYVLICYWHPQSNCDF